MAGKKKKGGGLLLGPMMIFFATSALWKNEHRFDYAKAAGDTVAVDDVKAVDEGQLFSHTSEMDQGLTIPGHYVDSFTGYLRVNRSAEIYAWDRDEDDDGVDWTLEWMSYLEKNDRNEGLRKRFKSDRFTPDKFEVGELKVTSEEIEFVDRMVKISPSELKLVRPKQTSVLEVRDDSFYFSKGNEEQLGDERITYRGLSVPAVATYFGKFEGGQALAHKVATKEGMVNDLIGNKGVLHHLVAGERDVALVTMQEHIKRLKMIVRVVASIVNLLGAMALFSFLARFLFRIPFFGEAARFGVGLLAGVVGIGISVVTIGIAFVTSQPLVLAMVAVIAVVALFVMFRSSRKSQMTLKDRLEAEAGHSVSDEELKAMQFAELVRLAASDGTSDFEEMEYLQAWGKQQGWDNATMNSKIREARAELDSDTEESVSSETHVKHLVHLALADGDLSGKELKVIRRAADSCGIGATQLSQVIKQVRGGALVA